MEREPLYVALGDSTGTGVGAQSGGGYPERLVRLLRARLRLRLRGLRALSLALRAASRLALSGGGALAEISTRAKDLGYRCWRIESPLFNPDNFNRRENDIFNGQGAFALLAIPEEVEVNLGLDQYAELD